jgi:hypothetical protein
MPRDVFGFVDTAPADTWKPDGVPLDLPWRS